MIPLQDRENFIEEVVRTRCSIRSAAEKYNINFSTAKAIYHTYKLEGRIGKKEHRVVTRKIKKNLYRGRKLKKESTFSLL
jgi:hypothetical protein